jgi:hypothetical protein
LGVSQVFSLLGGELSGVGTVSGSLINSAVIHPGDAPGALAVYGSFTGNSSGALEIEIAGPSSSGQYGQLNFPFNSQAAIGGALNVTFDNGFVPAAGDRYSIVTGSSSAGGSFSGVFASLNGLRPTNGVVLVPVYTGSGVVLAVANDPIISSPPRRERFQLQVSDDHRPDQHCSIHRLPQPRQLANAFQRRRQWHGRLDN